MTGQETISDLQHRLEVGLVEVRPEQRGAGRVDLDALDREVLEVALEVGGDTDHLVGVGTRAREDDRGAAVLADGRAGHRLDHVSDAGLGLEHPGHLGEDLGAGSLGDGSVGGVHDDLDGGGGVAAEALLGELACGDGLRAVGLPAGAGQVVLDLGGEGAEADDQQQPDAGDELGVVGDPEAEAAEGAGAEAGGEVGGGAPRRGGGGAHGCSVR